MEALLRDKSCAEFTALLASRAATPGGGGAAALMGALSAALCSMAALLTAGRKKYVGRREELEALAASAQEESRALLALIDRDAEGFLPLAAAYALPRDGANTAERLRAATLQACEAPLEMLRCCAAAAALLERMLEEGSPALLSDVGCGSAACRAAMEAAAMNVLVNTRTLPGDAQAAALAEETEALLRGWLPRLQRVTDRAMAYLREENNG